MNLKLMGRQRFSAEKQKLLKKKPRNFGIKRYNIRNLKKSHWMGSIAECILKKQYFGFFCPKTVTEERRLSQVTSVVQRNESFKT